MFSMAARKLPRRTALKASATTLPHGGTIVMAVTTTTGTHALPPAPDAQRGSPSPLAFSTASGGDAARRHQTHLQDGTDECEQSRPVSKHPGQEQQRMSLRGGPCSLDELQLHVVARTPHFLVLNKHADHRLDGAFDATIEKALHRDFPDVTKFRWIHQLDFATSGVMCIGLEKTATAVACRLFREKHVQKEYLALVYGHLPRDPQAREAVDGVAGHNVCALSKTQILIQDTDALERMRTQLKGGPTQRARRDYPRGVRQAPAFWQQERSALLRTRSKQLQVEEEQEGEEKKMKEGVRPLHPLTAEQQAILQAEGWKLLPSALQERYTAQSLADQKRYRREFTAFLVEEKERLRQQRRYDTGAQPNEPVGYVFEERIAEPDRDTFRMRIGDPTAPPEDLSRVGRPSATLAFVVGHGSFQGEPVTKVLLRPLTGRRHQLRLHLAHHGFPIVGDATYAPDGRHETAPRMMLHAWRLWLMATPAEQERLGDLRFTTEDPFEEIVASERELTTMT